MLSMNVRKAFIRSLDLCCHTLYTFQRRRKRKNFEQKREKRKVSDRKMNEDAVLNKHKCGNVSP